MLDPKEDFGDKTLDVDCIYNITECKILDIDRRMKIDNCAILTPSFRMKTIASQYVRNYSVAIVA